MSDHTKIALVNGRDHGGNSVCVRLEGDRIIEVGAKPARYDHVLDLQGDRVLPGMINAHDHLQLNHFPAIECRNDYRNASEWIADVQVQKQANSSLQAAVAIERRTRLLTGGIKNLLSGVTTVAHHDPWYDMLGRDDFPVRVVARYGWSHSIFIDGEEQVRDAHSLTKNDMPWIVHAAEGIDAVAAMEFTRLMELGCITAKTVLVHGIALTGEERVTLAERGAGMIWCPASNLRLFGRSAAIDELLPQGRVALGTDSRLSGSRDLLEELHIASGLASLDESQLEALVTSNAASLLRLHDRGTLRYGHAADLVVLPQSALLSKSQRTDVRLVICRGVPVYGDRAYMQTLAPDRWAAVRVDGARKALGRSLFDSLNVADVREPGLDLHDVAWKVA